MFTDEQIKELSAPLNPANVKSRTQGGSQVSYIESWHAENEANRIFGFDAWDRETEIAHIGEREHDGKWRVYYRAKVRITVRSAEGGVTVREGCGFGSGIDRDIGQAHESALKEAESDAEKRALKTFGNPFGQALYDKTKANVQAPPQDLPTGPINDATRDWVSSRLDGRQIPVGDLCKAFEITSLKALTYEQIEDVKNWIRDYQKEAA